jgi:uncharacterized membrane protein
MLYYTPVMPRSLIPIGRIFYAIGLIGIGVQHFLFADFIWVIMPAPVPWLPGRAFWAYAFGAALIAAGAAILFDFKGRKVAAFTGAAFIILIIVAHVPTQVSGSPGHIAVWNNAFKALTLCGGAWVVAGSLKEQTPGLPRFLEAVMPFGKYFLPITVITFGIEHFIYKEFVAKLVPTWIPGGGLFWTYFAGVALILAGVAMIVNIQARLASLLLGTMIFLWFLFLHIPRAIADPHTDHGNEWTSVFEALAFSGIAFMLAALPASNRFAISAKR